MISTFSEKIFGSAKSRRLSLLFQSAETERSLKRRTFSAGEKSVRLVDGTKVLGEWTEIDLSKLGSVDALDFHLSSSRGDLPLYCCLDDLIFNYSAIYY